jgi:hypothetical protein
MPVDTTHPEFDTHIQQWERMRDAYAGDDAIKQAGTKYLPKIDPTQRNDEYSAYKSRASYFEAVGRTVEAFAGAISRRPHSIKLPPELELLVTDATGTGMSLAEFAKHLCSELLLIGRVGIIVDVDGFDAFEIHTVADEKKARADHGARLFPYLVARPAESIISWSDSSVILREFVYETDPTDRFKQVEIPQIRELSLVDGIYQIQLWRQVGDGWEKKWVPYGEAIVPISRGQPFNPSYSGHRRNWLAGIA